MALTAVRLADPIRQPGLVLLDDIHASIDGASIDDDVFQVGVALQQHRADGFFQELCLVEGWRDDADPGPGCAIWQAI